MPSLDFDLEKATFRDYYDTNRQLLGGATQSFVTLIQSLLTSGNLTVSKIEARVKDREECISKFTRKYRSSLETTATPYAIKDHITDLIGLRIVCLYADEVDPIKTLVRDHFDVIAVTDKIAQIEGTENSFGYKGLHLDLKLNAERIRLPEYALYGGIAFELQIRTVVQDSWSILDHKIKYKKSIPPSLKRRINILAALFELADSEFREIRDATTAEIQRAEREVEDAEFMPANQILADAAAPQTSEAENLHYAPLNAFRFLKIAKHFFPGFEFEAHKVDGFTAEIVNCKPDISRGKFNYYMKENIGTIKRYEAEFKASNPNDSFNAYTVIRHCLYAGDSKIFESMLNNVARNSFEAWRAKNDDRQAA